jgi:hypothetical protein
VGSKAITFASYAGNHPSGRHKDGCDLPRIDAPVLSRFRWVHDVAQATYAMEGRTS